MDKAIKQKVKFNVSPHEVYEALMDSKKHSDFTGDKAVISREVNGEFTAFNGWIKGKNLELVKDKKIVQEWAGTDEENSWPKGHFSKVTFELKKDKEGTLLEFTHEDIPDGWYDELVQGWEEHYWEPMKKFFEK
ncbi:MAG: SRPBCC family protein [Nanoarchaeota archaeon]